MSNRTCPSEAKASLVLLRASFLMLSVRHDGSVEIRAVGLSVCHDGVLQVGALKTRAAQIGAMEIGTKQINAGKNRTAQVGAVEISFDHVGEREIDATQIH